MAIEASTAKVPQEKAARRKKAVPQSTAKKLERKSPVPQGSAKGFAVLDDLEDEADFDIFAGLDAKVWRVELRYRLRKDGSNIMYWNYRRRKIRFDADGNRKIDYLKGGNRVV